MAELLVCFVMFLLLFLCSSSVHSIFMYKFIHFQFFFIGKTRTRERQLEQTELENDLRMNDNDDDDYILLSATA